MKREECYGRFICLSAPRQARGFPAGLVGHFWRAALGNFSRVPKAVFDEKRYLVLSVSAFSGSSPKSVIEVEAPQMHEVAGGPW
jgi:hypothetical protein